jgi:ribosomal protein L10
MVEKKISRVPEYKKKIVSDLANKIKKSKTVLIASSKGLPGGQFHSIKKNLRGKAEMIVVKKSLLLRAIASVEKGALQNLKDKIGSDIVLLFSNIDAFELSALLAENRSSARAKTGDIAPEDIKVEPGPTELLPGPAISELGAVGLKVAVEGGKLTIKQGTTVVKKDEVINEKVSSVLGKLKIMPMKVGFIPTAAYDSKSDVVYFDIKIDKKGALEELRNAISKAFGFAVNIGYVAKETLSHFIMKAVQEEKAIEKIVNEKNAGEKNE